MRTRRCNRASHTRARVYFNYYYYCIPRQAGLCWFRKASADLRSAGFVACPVDPCVFRKRNGADFHYVALYVDDVLHGGNSPSLQRDFEEMAARYNVPLEASKGTDMAAVTQYLGVLVDAVEEELRP